MQPIRPEEAWKLVETSALVAPADDRAVIVVTGPDRVSWLNGLLTADVSRARPGDAAFSFLCEKKGKIVCDLHAFFEGDRVDLLVPAATRAAVLAALDHHLIMEDVGLAESARPVFRVYGPQSRPVLEALGGRAFQVGGGPGGAEVGLFLGGDDVDAFAEALAGALREVGGALVSAAIEEQLRVRLGLPRFGVDYDGAHYPQESALHTLGVSFSKGCYLGQEVLYMLENRGHAKQRLARLVGGEAPAPVAGTEVVAADGAVVGTVTSAALDAGGWSAIAMLKRAAASPGTALACGGVACTVHAIGLSG